MSGYHETTDGRDVSRYITVAMRETAEGHIIGTAPASPHLHNASGAMQTGALLTLLDNVGGICGGLASLPDGWVVTTNLTARVLDREPAVGPLRVDADVLRRGRNNVVVATTMRDDGRAGSLVADGVVTSAILVPENGPPIAVRPLAIGSSEPPGETLPRLDEWIGVRTIDERAIEIDLTDIHRNPWGILHGGVVATLVDLAAEHATARASTDVVLHFLAPNRVGPVRAVAELLGARSDGELARIEIRDEGAGRVTAVALVTCC